MDESIQAWKDPAGDSAGMRTHRNGGMPSESECPKCAEYTSSEFYPEPAATGRDAAAREPEHCSARRTRIECSTACIGRARCSRRIFRVSSSPGYVASTRSSTSSAGERTAGK